MERELLDRIQIRGLRLRCIVGVREWERTQLQDVVLDITLHADLTTPCRTDSLEDTVDYVKVKNRVVELVEGSSYQLLEGLCEAVAEACLEDTRVRSVDVAVEKPGALSFARAAAVEITRGR